MKANCGTACSPGTKNLDNYMNKTRNDFSKAAPSYSRHAKLQQESALELIDRLKFFNLTPEIVVDLGCGTGLLATRLADLYPNSRVLAVDFALGMCRKALADHPRPGFICADITRLPFAPVSVDVFVSNFTLQWCDEPAKIFADIYDITRPGGIFLFSMVGRGSLVELESCWSKVDEHKRIRSFHDMHDIGDMLYRSGWRDPVMDVEKRTEYFAGVEQIFLRLKKLGATNKEPERGKGLSGRGKFTRFRDEYEKLRCNQGLPLSWEIIYGYAGKHQLDGLK